jgi:molecular chaperone GrpE (heat shock protein)
MENYRNRAKSENQFGKKFHSESRLLNIFDSNDCAKRIRIRSKCEPNLKVNVKKLEDQFNS